MLKQMVISNDYRSQPVIIRGLRWFIRLDRSYFLALSAFMAAFVASLLLAFIPQVERDDGTILTLIEDSGVGVIVLLVLPVLVMAAPLLALPQAPGDRNRNDKVNSIASTGVLLAFVVAFLTSIGLPYLPALIFSIASSVSLFFGRDRNPYVVMGGSGGKFSEGTRLSRNARRRANREATAENSKSIESTGETPLESSRRRRGRNRRRNK